jgi:hypothetical protein
VLLGLTVLCQLVLVWLYRGAGMAWLPPVWTTPASSLLALPAAPAGAVSVTVWLLTCRSVVRRVLAPLVAAPGPERA